MAGMSLDRAMHSEYMSQPDNGYLTLKAAPSAVTLCDHRGENLGSIYDEVSSVVTIQNRTYVQHMLANQFHRCL